MGQASGCDATLTVYLGGREEEACIRSLRLQCRVKKVSGQTNGKFSGQSCLSAQSFPGLSLTSLPRSVIHWPRGAQGGVASG